MRNGYFANQIRLARRGSMILTEGFRDLSKASPLQRKRLAAIFAGRALEAKRAGRHNTAAAWFDNSARLT